MSMGKSLGVGLAGTALIAAFGIPFLAPLGLITAALAHAAVNRSSHPRRSYDESESLSDDRSDNDTPDDVTHADLSFKRTDRRRTLGIDDDPMHPLRQHRQAMQPRLPHYVIDDDDPLVQAAMEDIRGRRLREAFWINRDMAHLADQREDAQPAREENRRRAAEPSLRNEGYFQRRGYA